MTKNDSTEPCISAQLLPSGKLWEQPPSDHAYPVCVLCITLHPLILMDGIESAAGVTRHNFENFLKSLAAYRGAKVTSDGGRFFVQRIVQKENEVDKTVALALTIFYAMDGFNADPLEGNQLRTAWTASIIIHRDSVMASDGGAGPGFEGELSTFFSEESVLALARGSGIVITTAVHDRLNNRCLKGKFKKLPIEDNTVAKAGPFWSHSCVDQPCRLATTLDDRLKEVFVSMQSNGDASDLWYMLIRASRHRACERRIKVAVDDYTLSLHKYRLPRDLRQLARLRGNATTPLGQPDWRTY